MKLRFRSVPNELFVSELKQKVNEIISQPRFMKQCRRKLWLKLFLYGSLFAGSYVLLFAFRHPGFVPLLLNYFLIGFTGMLLAFNAAHDAVHRTFSRNRQVNDRIYELSFNLQGVSGMLWRKRHIASHHVFPNVDGCDADIDDNPFIRLSSGQPLRRHHRWQHIYSTLVYLVYTIHWVFLKDFAYLRKKELANLKSLSYSWADVAGVCAWKIIYLMLAVVIPSILHPFKWVILSFLIMHACISLFFVWTLIISHLCEPTSFPSADENGQLPFSFHWHQLAVSLDYHPESKIANWIFGGFNAHSAHHLFHKLPHTAYPYISAVIRETAAIHGYPYHSLPMHKAIWSHYRYLKQIGRAIPLSFSPPEA